MKTNKKLQTALVAILALAIGFIAGIYSNFPATSGDDAAGTIGQVDRYRNVKITENDIELRNSLVDDPDKYQAYKTYLQYYYYKALRTSMDINTALENTRKSEGFIKARPASTEAIGVFGDYLRRRRVDIFDALRTIAHLEKDKPVPVINHLNKANDVVNRIKANEKNLILFTDNIREYIANNPKQRSKELIDAHDIITTNLMQGAVWGNDKPMTAYLKEDGLLNNQSELKMFYDGADFQAFMGEQITMDAEKLGLLVLLNNKEELAGEAILDMGSLGVFDAEKLGINSAESLQDIQFYDMDKLGSYLYFDQENLNSQRIIGSQSNIFGSAEALRGGLLGIRFLDSENLGNISVWDAEKLGFVLSFADSESLGTGTDLGSESLSSGEMLNFNQLDNMVGNMEQLGVW